MLDTNIVYGEPRSIVTAGLRSFMGTYMIGIRKRRANLSDCSFVYVKAMSKEHAFEVANKVVGEKDWIVKSVEAPGEELYGLTEGAIGAPYFGGKYLNYLPEPTHYV
jgi:hypothetical protein